MSLNPQELFLVTAIKREKRNNVVPSISSLPHIVANIKFNLKLPRNDIFFNTLLLNDFPDFSKLLLETQLW